MSKLTRNQIEAALSMDQKPATFGHQSDCDGLRCGGACIKALGQTALALMLELQAVDERLDEFGTHHTHMALPDAVEEMSSVLRIRALKSERQRDGWKTRFEKAESVLRRVHCCARRAGQICPCSPHDPKCHTEAECDLALQRIPTTQDPLDTILCPDCESANMTASSEEEKFLYGWPDMVELRATVVVWKCPRCGCACTDGDAEEARAEAVRQHLNAVKPRT